MPRKKIISPRSILAAQANKGLATGRAKHLAYAGQQQQQHLGYSNCISGSSSNNNTFRLLSRMGQKLSRSLPAHRNPWGHTQRCPVAS